MLTSKAALEGERKQVTVLFADLKGSMELLAERDPEEARKILDPVLERMMEAVHHYEGTVNQVMGDGIMALFGAPLAHEDHAVRACHAALRMQRRINLYAEEIQRRGDTPVQIRVGLNSGEVVVRSIGSDLHMDYTAVGQTTHLAARVEQIARPGSSLITGHTLRLAEGFIQVRSLGEVTVKGLDIPTQVHELVGSIPTRSRFQVSAARGLTHFVGRERELQQLAEALDHAATGHGQTVALVGEAGVGKSRLAWEFTRSHRTLGWLVLESGSTGHGRAAPYLAVIELLKAYCGITESEDEQGIRERVTGKLLALDRALEPLLTPLLALLDVPTADDAWEALDSAHRRQRTLDAVVQLLVRESQGQPLLLLFEDLHWIDSETQALLDHLVERLPTTRVLLLVTYRPEYEHGWGRKSHYVQLRIGPFGPAGADMLLGTLLGEDPSLHPLKQRLIGQTEGNAFFLEESVRTLVESGVLAGQRGTYRLLRPPDSLQIPATAQAILGARIDRLPPEHKRLLQAASVVGKDIPFRLLEAIAETPHDTLRSRLTDLQAAEFLYETSMFPDQEFTFKHALTHEVAYGTMLQDRRRHLHAQIVQTIERLYPDRLTEHVERLAHHALRAEAWDKAAAFLRQAGMKAFAHSAHRAAAGRFEQALTALERLPRTRDTIENMIDVKLTLRNTLLSVGEVPTVLRHLDDAAMLCDAIGDRGRAAWISAYTSTALWSTGRYVDAIERTLQTQQLANDLEHGQLRVYSDMALTLIYHSLGRYAEGVVTGTRAAEALAGERLLERFNIPSLPSVAARTWLVSCLAELGDFPRAAALALEAVEVARMVGEPWTLVNAHLGLGILYIRQGETEKAAETLDDGLDICRRFNIDVWFGPLALLRGHVAMIESRLDDALALLSRGIEQIRTSGVRFYRSLGTIWMGEAKLRVGAVDEARGIAMEALRGCERFGERGNEAYALRLLGDIAYVDPQEHDAEDCYRQALALATALDMRPLIGQCHLSLGRLAAERGDPVSATEHLSAAVTLFSGLGMDRSASASMAELQRLPT
ncbi:MAG TPA: adenylate/guanylate cyclase domain-containing protein [Methylomirabilota bacterium]|nr:adenylate/guanylate cyclase domain-containing protein [Methylomirabilota bacterium]